MIRSPIGISKIPVSSEIDPGFGPDTEQRRVEFAAKLEEEAFAVSIGDATKLARTNLITALRIWKKDAFVKFVKELDLRDIMIIWLIFEVSYIAYVLAKVVDQKACVQFCSSKNKLREFLQGILASLHKDVPKEMEKIQLDVASIGQIRENYGGDLIFSLKRKNENEVIKLYQMTYNKLPKSLRDKYFEIITGVKIDYERLTSVLRGEKDKLLINLLGLITEQMGKLSEYQQSQEKLSILEQIIAIFDQKAAEYLKGGVREQDETSKEVEEKVKRYYGIE